MALQARLRIGVTATLRAALARHLRGLDPLSRLNRFFAPAPDGMIEAYIREAIVYLGRETIKRWVTLYLMASVDEKPNELLTLALVRAKLCELIAQKQGRTDVDTYFTVGLFSILDSLLDLDIASILKQLHVTPEMRAALLHSEGTRGEVLTCAREVEAGHLGKLPCAGLDALEVATLHTQAINWADDSLREMGIRN